MRFERTEPFKSDYQRRSEDEREKFRTAARNLNAACNHFLEANDPLSWPHNLRVKAVVNAPGIFEMTWSFSGPEGRATWEWTTVIDTDGRQWPAVRWRGLGTHRIFREP
ncbi:MAG TPA: hypothetical protein VND88_00010 [Candidatus Acidoferrales bacterium]|nr:hypothetical protein [Candidatus Acidoferrales bacterium]